MTEYQKYRYICGEKIPLSFGRTSSNNNNAILAGIIYVQEVHY